MTLLGIDYGAKKVGVAVSDERETIAFPLSVLSNDSNLIETITSLAQAKGVSGIVIGESKNFSMKDNPIMEHIRDFAEAVKKRSGLPISFEPEFLTSAQAGRGSTEEARDAGAAALILQSFLDKKRGTRTAATT
jgi:putative Holliday junction resolvase